MFLRILSSSPESSMSSEESRGVAHQPSLSSLDVASSPSRALNHFSSSQQLQTGSFSASQTALLGRNGSMTGSFSPTIDSHEHRGGEDAYNGRSDGTQRRSSETAMDCLLMSRSPALEDSPVFGMAITTELSPSASLGESFASHSFSMHPSSTQESLLRDVSRLL